MPRARRINIIPVSVANHDHRSADRITSPRTRIDCWCDGKQIYLSGLNLIKCNELLVY